MARFVEISRTQAKAYYETRKKEPKYPVPHLMLNARGREYLGATATLPLIQHIEKMANRAPTETILQDSWYIDIEEYRLQHTHFSWWVLL